MLRYRLEVQFYTSPAAKVKIDLQGPNLGFQQLIVAYILLSFKVSFKCLPMEAVALSLIWQQGYFCAW